MSTKAPYRFHAFDVSYFSAKVRPALRYKQLWFEELRADIREILRRTGMAFIPIVITPEDETWQDSTDIYDQLERRHPEPPLFPSSPVHRMLAHLVELYVDEFGVTPAMHTRWGSNEATTRARFAAMTGSREQGEKAGDQMVRARFAVGASDEAGPAIEAHIHDLLDALSAHFDEHAYLFGGRMCFADCALMGPLYAHFFVDLTSRKLLLETAVPTVGWIERCNAPNPDGQGDWWAGDAAPDSLRQVLGAMGRDAAPVILAGARCAESWADERPADAEMPRTVGAVETTLRGTPFKKAAQTYTLFMLQRTLDAYAALPAASRTAVDEIVAGTGWDEVLAHEPRHRVEKRGFALAFA